MKKGIKIVTIGGGSSYTPELVEGIIKRYDELPIHSNPSDGYNNSSPLIVYQRKKESYWIMHIHNLKLPLTLVCWNTRNVLSIDA